MTWTAPHCECGRGSWTLRWVGPELVAQCACGAVVPVVFYSKPEAVQSLPIVLQVKGFAHDLELGLEEGAVTLTVTGDVLWDPECGTSRTDRT